MTPGAAPEARPSIVILAGPNGAGKSTAAPALLHGALGVDEFVNADVIARGLSAFDPERVALAAGRVMRPRRPVGRSTKCVRSGAGARGRQAGIRHRHRVR